MDLISNQVLESERKKFGITLEGGGVLGGAEVGALIKLHEYGMYENKTYISCSSVGAIIGGAMACKASAQFIKDAMDSLDYNKCLDDSWGVIADLTRLLSSQSYGWYKGEYFEKWYGDLIEQITGNRNITLKQVHERYGTYIMITTLLNYQKTILVDHEKNPDLELVSAVSRAWKIPFMFKAAKEWITVQYEKGVSPDYYEAGQILALYADGGTFLNYPIGPLADKIGIENIVGLKLMSNGKLHELYAADDEIPSPPKNIIDVIFSLFNTARELAMKIHVPSEQWNRSIIISIGDVKSTDFSISNDTKKWLFEQGLLAVDKFLITLSNNTENTLNTSVANL